MARATAATPSLLRQMNAHLVLDVLRSGETLRVTEIVARTKLSRPTVDAVADDLVELGLVHEVRGGGRPGRGRPARELTFRSDAGVVVGMEVQIQHVLVLVADLTGHVVTEHTQSLRPNMRRKTRIAAILAAVQTALRRADMPPDRLRALGVATPGIVDALDGSVRYCNTIPNWSAFNLRVELEIATGCAVTVDNDANAAVTGERWSGAANGVDDVIFMLAGRRGGAGAVIGGQLVRGSRGSAGEIGFLQLWEQDGGGFGNRIHQLAAREIVHIIDPTATRANHEWNAEPREDGGQIDPPAILAAARAGDAHARQRLQQFLARTTFALATMSLLLNPELIVIGGDATATPELIDPLRRMLDDFTNPLVLEPPRVIATELGKRAVALGALAQAMDIAYTQLPHSSARKAP